MKCQYLSNFPLNNRGYFRKQKKNKLRADSENSMLYYCRGHAKNK